METIKSGLFEPAVQKYSTNIFSTTSQKGDFPHHERKKGQKVRRKRIFNEPGKRIKKTNENRRLTPFYDLTQELKGKLSKSRGGRRW